MLEEFSGGYYRVQMSVQEVERGPVIERGLYDLIARRIYDTTDAPVTVRLGLDAGPRFTPTAENGVPTNVIGLPKSLLTEAGVHPGDNSVNVFVLKPSAAYRFNQTMDPGADYCYDENGSCSDENE
jgi:hypothetical protein